MTTWTSDELNQIGNAEKLQIASLRRDGTLRNLVTIWVVRLEEDLFVRSIRGPAATWYTGAQVRRAGRIWAGDVEKDVMLVEETDPDINERIDAAYRAKYSGYPSTVAQINSPEARATSLKLVPRQG